MKEVFIRQHQVLSALADVIKSGELFSLNMEEAFSNIPEEGKIWLLGAGKASLSMAREVEKWADNRIHDGIIIAPEDSREFKNIQVFKGSHPLPDAQTVAASYELLNMATKIPAGDTVIFCLSGGASSMFCIPSGNIEIDELSETYHLLLRSGADISQINTVRKHLSDTAGGKTLQILAKNKVHSIILPDVPDDDLSIIGGGPTIGDTSTFKKAFQLLKQFELWEQVPHAVRIHITKGMQGRVSENPTDDNLAGIQHQITVIPGAAQLAKNVGKELQKQGYNIQIPEQAYNDDIRQAAKKMCGDAISVVGNKSSLQKPAALIYYGESSVKVKGGGKGGRNQEIALNAALSLEGQHHISILSMGTDGVDGPTDAAGAIVNSETALLARKQKLNPEQFLQDNNSYTFHKAMQSLIKSKPTGINLMDIQVILVE